MTKHLINSIIVILIVCAIGLPLVLWGGLNEDEGFYPYVGTLLYEGNDLYKDVMFTQTPMSAYVYGFVYYFINSSIFTGRLTALLMYLIAAVVLYFALARLFSPGAGLLGALVAIFCPQIGTVGLNAPITYPITEIFIALSLLAYSFKSTHKYILIGTLIGLACMTRLTAIFAILFFIFLERKKWLQLSIGCLIGILPFSYILLQDPQATIFCLFTYHTDWYIASQSYWAALKLNYIMASVVAILPLLLLCAMNGFKYGKEGLAAVGLVAAIQWLPHQTLLLYNAFMFPIIGYVAAENINHFRQEHLRKLALIPLLVSVLLTLGINQGFYQPHQLKDTREMAQYLQEITEPGEQIFTYHTYIVIEAGLTVDKRQAMAVFSYWGDGTISNENAVRFNVIDSTIEKQILNQNPRVLILADYEAKRMDLTNYRVVRHYDKFGQFQHPFDIWLLKE